MDPLQIQPEALLEVWGVCFRDHLQLEPMLNHCKRRGRTMIAKPHGEHKAHGGCCLGWG